MLLCLIVHVSWTFVQINSTYIPQTIHGFDLINVTSPLVSLNTYPATTSATVNSIGEDTHETHVNMPTSATEQVVSEVHKTNLNQRADHPGPMFFSGRSTIGVSYGSIVMST